MIINSALLSEVLDNILFAKSENIVKQFTSKDWLLEYQTV